MAKKIEFNNLTEFCDKKKAHWLLDNIDDVCEQLDIVIEPKQMVIKYCKEVLKSQTGFLKRNYQNNDGVGRMFLKKRQNGFQNMKRKFRSILASDDYFDLDVKNCHPVILLQYCQKNDINYYYLEKYVKNRDDIINETNLSKDLVKMQFLKVLYGGKFNWDEFSLCDEKIKKFLKKFALEMKEILSHIVKLNPDILSIVQKSIKEKEYDNDEGSVCALLCQNIENTIIQNTLHFLRIKKFDVGVLCFDGVMVRNTLNISKNIITDLNNYIQKKTDYKIEFVIKPFIKYIDIPAGELNYEDETLFIDDDKEGVDFLLKKLSNKVVKCGSRFFIRKEKTNIYIEDTSSKFENSKNWIFKFINEFDIKINGASGPKPYSKTTRGTSQLLIMLWANLPEDEKFLEKLWHSNLYKLCFLDGYYDFKTKEFFKYDDQTFTTVFINRKFSDLEKISQKDTDYLNKKIIDPILFNPEQQKYILNWLSRGLAGHFEEKTWACGLGNRNSGKSVIADLCCCSLGGYADDFTAEQLIVAKIGNTDVSKKMGWSIPFEFRRLNFSNELKTKDDNDKILKLDGDLIKRVSSGGDSQKARLNYKDDVTFKIQGRMILFMNDLIPITVQDAYQTASFFNFQSIFKDEITKEELEINNLDDTQCKYFKKDENLKIEIKTNDNLQLAFIKLLIDNYTSKPIAKPEIIINNDDFKDDDNDEEASIKRIFDITQSSNDLLSIKEFNISIKENTLITKAKAKLILQKLGCREIRTSKDRYFAGIKYKTE